MRSRYRTSPRLAAFTYRGPFAYFVTAVTRGRHPAVTDSSAVTQAIGALHTASEKYDFNLHAYTFMPDHVHLLLSGGADSVLGDLMRFFKQLSGYAYKRSTGHPLWQISYYDRVRRREEAMEDVARYIWANPVRAGLVSDAGSYPFAGPSPLPERW